MEKHDRIPALNDLRFIPANDSLPLRYNTWPFDRGHFEAQIREYQRKLQYQQKRNYSDWITFYIDTLSTNIIFHTLDEDGNVLATEDFSGAYAAYEPGNTAPNGSPYYTFVGRWQPLSLDVLPPGIDQRIHFYVIECTYGGEPVYYVSEPVYVRRDKWEGTQLIECRHGENDYDVLFEQVSNLVFRQRVDSTVELDEASMNDTAFTDQQYKQRTLQSVPNRIYLLTAGIEEGIPNYLWDKLNRMLSLSHIRIDGTRYTKHEGASWSKDGAKGYPMAAVSIQLQEYLPDEGLTYSRVSGVSILELPYIDDEIVYPFAFNFLSMSDGMGVATLSLARAFEDETELLDFIDTLNGALLPSMGLTGSMSVEDGVLKYLNGIGESYTAVPDMFCCYKRIEFTMRVYASGDGKLPLVFGPTGVTGDGAGNDGMCIIDWGDGIVEWQIAFGDVIGIEHMYEVAVIDKDYTFRMYHLGDDAGTREVRTFKMVAIASVKAVRVAAGTHIEVPKRMEVFHLENHSFNLVSSNNFSMLDRASNYLRRITIRASGLGGPNAFVPEFMAWGSSLYPTVGIIDISQNKLTTAQVNSAILSIDARSTPVPIKGMLDFRQAPTSPAAPPTGLALTTANNWFTSFLWLVLKD